MKLAPAALLVPLVALAQGDALFDDGAPADAPSSPAPAPFSEWDGVTQLFPAPSGKGFGEGRSPSPSLELVGEFELDKDAPEGLSGIAWTFAPDLFGRPVNYSERMPDGSDVFAPDSYALCEDSGGRVHWATIGLDLESGAVTSAVFRASWQPIGISASADLEGIAHKRRTNRRCALFLSDEGADHIYRRRLSPRGDHDAGASIMSAPLPDPLKSPRRNKGVEAMCLSPDENTLWVANEDSLPEDGPVSSTANGSRVRLYALDVSDRQWPPADPRWWFYELDPAAGGKMPHLPDPFNGLAELCALPDGRLLALERTYGLRTRSPSDPRASLIAISIYLVDPLHAEAAGSSTGPLREGAAERSEAGGVLRTEPGAASETHGILPPAADAATPLSEGGECVQPPPSDARHPGRADARPGCLAKTLLWRGLTGRANYEGMTLGPELADGSRALLLVSDGDVTRKGAFAFPWSKRLLSFRLRLPDAGR